LIIQLTLYSQTSSTWTESLDAILDAYQKLGESLPKLAQYEPLFRKNFDMALILVLIFDDVLRFNRWVLTLFRSKGKIPLKRISVVLSNRNTRMAFAVPASMEFLQVSFATNLREPQSARETVGFGSKLISNPTVERDSPAAGG
jgi:hypothetical protein